MLKSLLAGAAVASTLALTAAPAAATEQTDTEETATELTVRERTIEFMLISQCMANELGRAATEAWVEYTVREQHTEPAAHVLDGYAALAFSMAVIQGDGVEILLHGEGPLTPMEETVVSIRTRGALIDTFRQETMEMIERGYIAFDSETAVAGCVLELEENGLPTTPMFH